MSTDVKPGYKQTEVGEIPEDWVYTPISSLIAAGTSITYGIVQAGPQIDNGIPYIRTGDMAGKKLLIDTLARTSRTIVSRYPRSTIRPGELVFSIRASVGAVHWVPPELDGANLTQGTARISPGTDINSKYLLYTLRSAPCQSWVDFRTKGTTYKEITLATLRELPIARPPTKAEQEAITEALSDADALIESLEQLVAKKRQIKQGAMQELLTGRKRLPGFTGEWETKRVGDCLLCSPEYGINAPAAPYSDLLPTYIRITDISEYGRFDPAPRVSVQSAIAHRYFLSEGDVLFARTGASVGKSYRYDIRDGQLVFAGFLIRVRPDPKKIAAYYPQCVCYDGTVLELGPAYVYAERPARHQWQGVRTIANRDARDT